MSKRLSYDKEKYKEMTLDAAETVLGYFGFSRTFYGTKKVTGPRKWMKEKGIFERRCLKKVKPLTYSYNG